MPAALFAVVTASLMQWLGDHKLIPDVGDQLSATLAA